MRALWIAIALTLFHCNNGQEETATVSEDLINDVFTKNTVFEDKSGAETTTVNQEFIDGLFNGDDSASENETETTSEDPNLTPKVAGVS